MRRIIPLLLCGLLLCGWATPVFAAENAGAMGFSVGVSGNVVTDETALRRWCEAHLRTGGTVQLGSDVHIRDGIILYGARGNFTLDTGPHSLIYDGGKISIDNLAITGEGVEKPVLEVRSLGYLRMQWSLALVNAHITATGRDGAGGTAVLLRGCGNSWPADLTQLLAQGQIRSQGRGAVGVQTEGPIDIYGWNIQAEGPGSVALDAPSGAGLYYCKLAAEGSAIRGEGILLDSCAVSPQPQEEGVEVISRRIAGLSGNRLYFPVRQGEALPKAYDLPSFFNLILAADNAPSREAFVYIPWDGNAYAAIDTATAGRHVLGGDLSAPLRGLGLEERFPLELVVDVREPDAPCIETVTFFDNSWEDQKQARLFFWRSDEWAADEQILWRSDDDGVTWTDATHSPDITWYAGPEYAHPHFEFRYDWLPHPVCFQVETPGFGVSNIVVLSDVDGVTTIGDGGDRTGIDRDGGSRPNPPGNEEDTDDDEKKPPKADDDKLGNTDTDDPDDGDGDISGDDPVPPQRTNATRESRSSGSDQPDNDLVHPRSDTAQISALPQAPANSTAPPEMFPSTMPPAPPVPSVETARDAMSVLSGERLDVLLAAYPQAVPFVVEGRQILVDAESLRALKLSGEQLLAVLWEAGDIRFFVDGAPVSLPWSEPNAGAAERTVTASVSMASIEPAAAPLDTKPNVRGSPYPQLCGGTVVAFGGGALLRRRILRR